MLSSFKNEPDTQKIIRDDSTAGRENVAQRIVYAMKIGFFFKEMGEVGAEYLEAANFYNGAQSSCNDEEQNLLLAYEYFFHLINIKAENILHIILDVRTFYK